jgi:DNA-binding transcriptional ArsR family regulator
LLVGRAAYSRLAAGFGAIADPTRAAIVHVLLHQELCTADLAAVLEISAPAASQHLRVLRNLRLVTSRREGKLVLYRLEDSHVAQLVTIGLAHEGETLQSTT